MTIIEFLKEKGISRYSLSKESGVPWTTIADLCSGKLKFQQCDESVLRQLAQTLDIEPSKLLQLEQGNTQDQKGKPKDKTYLETDLPPTLAHALEEYIQGEKDHVTHMDCLWGELYGSINACQWDGRITKEQADYLRKKYLY